MTDRFGAMTDAELGGAIADAARGVAWPEPPDVADEVLATIRAYEGKPSLVAPRLSMPSRRRTLLVVAAALLALAGAALAAKLVFDLGAIAVEVIPGPPPALPTTGTSAGDLGREVTLAEAEASAGFAAALPSALGPPARIWVDESAVGPEPEQVARRIVAAWPPSEDLPPIPGSETGAVLMQFEGEWEVASKLVSAETNRFGEALVEGQPAFWTTGAHELTLVSGDEPVRLLVTGSVLIWQDAGFTFRLETDLGKREAVRIAESVSPTVEID